MTAMTRPTSGQMHFRRLTLRSLLDALLHEEADHPSASFGADPARCTEAVETFLRPVAYLAQPIGSTQ